MNNTFFGIREEEGAVYSVLWKRLYIAMMNMVDALPKSTSSLADANRFLIFSRIALDTIPPTKISKELYDATYRKWEEVYRLLKSKSVLPEPNRKLTIEELILLHQLDSDIVRCIDEAGLGWGDFYGIKSKKDIIKEFIERGRS